MPSIIEQMDDKALELIILKKMCNTLFSLHNYYSVWRAPQLNPL